MSWLTGLAGKAEELLNKVDQTAATALQNESMEVPAPGAPMGSRKPDTYSPFLTRPLNNPSKAGHMASSASVPNNLSQMNTENAYLSQLSRPASALNQSKGSITPPRSKTKDKVKDDELFAFLNTPENGENGKKKDRPSKLSVNGHSRKSSASSVGSQRSSRTPESHSAGGRGTPNNPATPGAEDQDTVDAVAVDIEDTLINADSSSGYHSNQEDNTSQQQLSSLELENNLLKNEVASLNQEMNSVIHRAKSAQDELLSTRRQVDTLNAQLSQSSQALRELQSRESDVTEALQAKDSQLAVLRVRLEEADKELAGKKSYVDSLQAERNRILNDHTSSSGVQSQALDSLKEKLDDAEASLRREQENLRVVQQEWQDRMSQLQDEKQSLSESMAKAEQKLVEEKGRCSNLNLQMKSLRSQADAAKKELSEYKDKATRILQSKDRLISSLKAGAGGSGEASSAVTTAELEEVRQEREMLREELVQSRMTAENLRAEIQDLESSLQAEIDSLQESLRSLEEQLSSEQRCRQDADQELARHKQELRYAHEELLRQKTQFQSRLSDREEEIHKLRNQLSVKTTSSSSQVELENRLHTLTESLIQKQTMLEALSTEKNSLGLQLERLERQYADVQEVAARSHTTAVTINDDDEVRQRLPGFMRESPLDGDVARKVKRAANSIDKFSVRLGVFLRRYPIARIFVIVYMVMLHVWVMIVLLTYQPEIHTHDYNPQPPGSVNRLP